MLGKHCLYLKSCQVLLEEMVKISLFEITVLWLNQTIKMYLVYIGMSKNQLGFKGCGKISTQNYTSYLSFSHKCYKAYGLSQPL